MNSEESATLRAQPSATVESDSGEGAPKPSSVVFILDDGGCNWPDVLTSTALEPAEYGRVPEVVHVA